MKSLCYLDEFGNNGFDFSKPGVSTHFIVCGIVLTDDASTELQSLGDSISAANFGGSEIKSSNVGSDDDRRILVLREMLKGPFHIYSMVFDKRVMFGKGLHQKKSFYKFLNREAYQNLTQALGDVRLFADEHGTKEFMRSFQDYITKHLAEKDLFGYSRFEFIPSSTSRLVQFADFLAGTIARCYDGSVLSPKKAEYLSILFKSGRLLPIFEWPERRIHYSPDQQEELADPLDPRILRLSLRKAKAFIANNVKKSGDFVPEQIAAVRVLMHHILFGDPRRYVSTGTFLNYFSANLTLKVSKKQFGRSVIGPLRDATVLISSNKVGYKLVANVADLRQFVRYYHLFLGPMLNRMKKYRNSVLLASKGKLDILRGREYEYLRRHFDQT